MIITELGDLIADRMRAEHRTLAARWFERLLDLLPVDARDIFPTDTLLDHVPALIVEISGHMSDADDGPAAANTALLTKARELGALRHQQRASLHQILREYQLLAGVLVTFVIELLEALDPPPAAADGCRIVSRVHRTVNVLAQATIEAFVTLYTQTIAEQTERLEQFTRMAAHEWRQPLGALQFGVTLLRRDGTDPERTRRTVDALDRTVTHLIDLTRKLETVARMQNDADNPLVQEVSASVVASEAARQLREMSGARGVVVQVADSLPTLIVDVGRLELIFLNLLSNAIKYADPAKDAARVEVDGGADGDGWCRIQVRDNGIGIPAASLATIFQRFARAHAEQDGVRHVSGMGLGLSIVDDCLRAIGGTIDVTSAERVGTTFTLRLPTKPPAAV